MKNILKGASVLALAGLITRILGFAYKIYISNNLSTTDIGIYQLLMPIYSLAISAGLAGIHISISKGVAEKKYQPMEVLISGLKLTLIFSVSISLLMNIFSSPIAVHCLGSADCKGLVQILSIALPLGAIHSCISSYYIGMSQTLLPAISQLFEQITRILAVFFMLRIAAAASTHLDASILVWGLVLGELFSATLCIFIIAKDKNFCLNSTYPKVRLIKTGFPIALNRIMLSILNSLEAILIPLTLKLYGYNHDQALGLYGILTAMAFPFIFFPSTITNALSTMLLPDVAGKYSKGNIKDLKRTITLILKGVFVLGLVSTIFFLLTGNALGTFVFGEPLAGQYITILGWLCPFLYLSSILASILNGLGKSKRVFYHSFYSVFLRILFILITVPRIGITGYLLGLLASEILCVSLHLILITTHKECFDIHNN